MKKALVFIFALLCALTSHAQQFRLVGNLTGFATVVDDSTYNVSLSFPSDLTGNSFLPTQIADDGSYRIFFQTGRIYTVTGVANATFSDADLTLVEYGSTDGSPTGQALVFDPQGRESVPQSPLAANGASGILNAAIVSYNLQFQQGFADGDGNDLVLNPGIELESTTYTDAQALFAAIVASLNTKVDTLYERSDSLFYQVGGVETLFAVDTGGGGSLVDGDYGDVTVSGSGTVITINGQAVTFAKFQDIPENTFVGRDETGTGSAETLTPAEARTLLNVEDGATADQTATDVPITDAGAYYTGTDVESALQEVADTLTDLRTDLSAIASGAADGVATAGAYDGPNEEIDVTVAAPGADFSIDVSSLASDSELGDSTAQVRSEIPTTASDLPIVDAGGYYTTSDVESALQEEAVNRVALDQLVGDLIVLSGVPITSQDLGTFTGTTITDDNTVKGALQELETAVEAGGSGGIDSTYVKRLLGSHLILSDGYTIDVSGMTQYERGEALVDCVNNRLGNEESLYVPPQIFKIPQSSGGLSPTNRSSIFSLADRRAWIIADSCHLFNYDGIGGTYRSTISNLTLETTRTGEVVDDSEDGVPDGTNQWNIFQFDDVTGTTRGVISIHNIHIAECDNDVFHIGRNWGELSLENASMTGAGDIHGYVIYSNSALSNRFELSRTEGSKIYFDTASAKQTVVLNNVGDYLPTLTDLGDDNKLIDEQALQTYRKEIGGRINLIEDAVRNPEKIVFYSPLTPGSFNGNVLLDYTGRGQAGIAYGDIQTDSTVFGEVLLFDGVDDYIELPIWDIPTTDNKITVSFLVLPDSTGGNGAFVYGGGMYARYRPNEEDDSGFAYTIQEFRDGDYISDIWQHVTITSNGQVMKIWTNGVEQIDKSVTGDLNVGGFLTLGEVFGDFAKFHIKDLLIYNGYYDDIAQDLYAMSTRQIEPVSPLRQVEPLERGSVLFYHQMDNSSDADLGVERVTATVTGTVQESTIFGGTGLDFDGVNDRMNFGNIDALAVDDIFISALVRGDDLTNRRVVQKLNQFDLFVKNDGLYGRFYHSSGTMVELEYGSFNSTREGEYHVIGLGRLADTIYLTYDGIIVDQSTVSGVTWDSNTNSMYVGSSNTTNYWNGFIDEVVIVNTFSEALAQNIYSKIVRNEPLLVLPERFTTDDLSINTIYNPSGFLPDNGTYVNSDGAGFEITADVIDLQGVEVTVNGAPLSIRPKDTLNVVINAVMPQMSLGGGFESLNDGQYTEGSPLSIPAGDTVAVTITGGTALRSYLPPGYDSLYNRTTQRFEPTLVGENWMVRLNYKAKSTNNDGDVTIYMDIGDGTTPNYITGRVKRLPRGTGDEHQFSSTDAIFNLGTFVANGGRFVIVGGVGTTTIYDVNISFYRVSTPHGQVNVGDTPGYWTVPDDLIDAEIIGVQYAFRTAHSGGTIDMQLSDGTVGFAGTTIADGDRVQSVDLSGTPISLTSERLIQPVVVSSTATTLPKGLIVNLTIVK